MSELRAVEIGEEVASIEQPKDDRYCLCVFEKMLLTITNGFDLMFQTELNQTFLEEHKQKTGIEGAWNSFFDLFK